MFCTYSRWSDGTPSPPSLPLPWSALRASCDLRSVVSIRGASSRWRTTRPSRTLLGCRFKHRISRLPWHDSGCGILRYPSQRSWKLLSRPANSHSSVQSWPPLASGPRVKGPSKEGIRTSRRVWMPAECWADCRAVRTLIPRTVFDARGSFERTCHGAVLFGTGGSSFE